MKPSGKREEQTLALIKLVAYSALGLLVPGAALPLLLFLSSVISISLALFVWASLSLVLWILLARQVHKDLGRSYLGYYIIVVGAVAAFLLIKFLQGYYSA